MKLLITIIKKLEDITDDFDIIFETAANYSFKICKRLLKPKGIYLSTMMKNGILFQTFLTWILGAKRAKFVISVNKKKELEEICRLIIRKKLNPNLNKSFNFDAIAKHTNMPKVV